MLQSASKTLLRTQSDARLASLAAAGNEVAFAAIVERHTRLLTGVCRRVLPEAHVEDAVQQAFMAAWFALGRGDDVRELRPWLLRIARNTALNALRAPGYDYDVLRDSLQAAEAPPAELERREVIRSTLTGLAALPDAQREALLASAVHGIPQADIARELGVSEGAVRQLVLRARMALRTAATAVVPLPLAKWLAAVGQNGEPSAARIAELAAGAAPFGVGGAAAVLAKTSAVLVIAGGAAATPGLVDRVDRGSASPAPAVAEEGEVRESHVRKATPAGDPDLRAIRRHVAAERGDDDDDERGRRENDRHDDDDDDADRRVRRHRARNEPDDDASESANAEPAALGGDDGADETTGETEPVADGDGGERTSTPPGPGVDSLAAAADQAPGAVQPPVAPPDPVEAPDTEAE